MITDRSVGPNSFVDCRQPYNDQTPPPKYFDRQIILAPLPNKKEDILKGLEELPSGGLICVDKEAMEKQKGVLVDVVK